MLVTKNILNFVSKFVSIVLIAGSISVLSPIPVSQAVSIGNNLCVSDATSSSGVFVIADKGYCYVAFTSTGNNSWTAPAGLTSADFLIIAGGGAGGGGAWGGGGGAGEVVLYTNYSVTSSSSLSLNIGNGGAPGAASLDPAVNRSNPGGNSWIGSSSGVVARGGGAGASYAYGSSSTYSVGQNGGSGGGGTENTTTNTGGTSTKTSSGSRTGYGNDGGRGGPGSSTQSGGGGGGAGSAGTNAGTATGGNGGSGTNLFSTWLTAINSSMSGISGWQTATASGFIAGGGGGGTTTTRGSAGSGGAGRGGSNSDFYDGESAVANTGSGGGGSGYGGSPKVGGTGGSGLIIIRYLPVSSSNDSALTLNGTSQYATTPDNSALDISTTLTLAAWVNPATASGNMTVAGKAGAYLLQTNGGSWRYCLQGTGTYSCISTSIPVVANEWHHVAFTRNGNTVNFYIDGTLAFNTGGADNAATGNINNSSSDFQVGRQLSQAYFNGSIDEVRLWNVARTQSEIQSDLKTWGPVDANGLVAYYDFNEINSSYFLNRASSSSGSINLQIVNSPTLTSIETTTVTAAYTTITFPRNYLVAGGGWKAPVNRQLNVLLVGGGGGGNRGVCGVNYGAGGGGGQAKEETVSVTSNSFYTISVGVGGRKAIGNCNDPGGNTSGKDGASSGFGTLTVSGGTAALYNSLVGGSSGSYIGGTGTGTYGAGGGGGAGGNGSGNNGGAGYLSAITGLKYGGGGSGRNSSGTGTAIDGGSDGSSDAVANRGGGGADWSSGGSGIVVIRYITNAPTILTQPSTDTTTVGTVDTFTISTSVAPAPLTKSVQWQFTADTVTGTTGWTNISSGTGFTTDTFTTIAVTKAMNKYRYRAIVTFSDTSTLSVQETSTVAILTVNDAITFTSDTSTVTRKYGDTQTVRTISYVGGTTNTGAVGTSTSHTVRGQVGTQASSRITFDTSTSTAVFRVDTRTVIGSYTETITVTDARGATATYVQRVVINPADTLTIQADTLTAITFGGMLTPTATVTGLVSGDAVSATTFGHVSCANGGRCAVGDIGPGGGVVFYEITNSSDSQTAITGYTSGGIYLEAAPVGWGNGISVAAGETTGTSYLDPVVNWCNTASDINNRQIGIGQGGNNTKLGDAGCTSGALQIAADLVLNGKNDWYLPSENELIQMGLQKNLIGLIYGQTNCYGTTCYWSSTEFNGSSSRALQVNVGANAMGSNDKLLTASNQVMMRPIRAFSPITNNTETVTAGAPTAAGTYSIRPTAITLAGGVSTYNYVNVVYRSSSVTINRATQSPKISMQPAKAIYDTGTATQALTATSGQGTGTVFYLIGSGSAASCAVSGSAVRVTSEGVCNVLAFKQASTNYLYDSATAVAITFTKFVPRPVQVQLYPSMIPMNQGNALETTTVTSSTLMISSATKTGAGAYTIAGTGFSSISIVRIGGTDLTVSNYTHTPTSISLTGVAALTGPLFIRLSDGQEAVFFQFTWP